MNAAHLSPGHQSMTDNRYPRDDEPLTEIPRRLIAIAEASFLTSLPPVMINELWQTGRFPRPVCIRSGKRRHIAFLRAEIAEWIAEQIRQRDAEPEIAVNDQPIASATDRGPPELPS
jgi:predicted DNA-binding transcriptional regulator AlpA